VTVTDPLPVDPDRDDDLHPAVRGGLALWTLFVGFTMLMVGNGLNLAVLGIRMVDEGFDVQVSGIVMASYFAGFLLGPLLVVRWLSSVGHIRVFASLASTASCVVLVHFVWVNPIAWSALRFVFGFCMAGLYVVVESWLNDASTPRTRGRTLAVYMIASMGGLGLGQLLVATGDPSQPVLFVVASILVSLSFVPIALAATTEAPPIRLSPKMRVREFLRVAPTGFVGILFTGASHGILFGLAAVYATRAGFGPGATAAFLALPSIGAIVFQWPIGWASDRLPRRSVIFVVAVGAAGMAAGAGIDPRGERGGAADDVRTRRAHLSALFAPAVAHARPVGTGIGDGGERCVAAGQRCRRSDRTDRRRCRDGRDRRELVLLVARGHTWSDRTVRGRSSDRRGRRSGQPSGAVRPDARSCQ
jgi:MFS family permease